MRVTALFRSIVNNIDLLNGAGIFNNIGELYDSGWLNAKDTSEE